ncbi:DNA-binding response regulator [Candidatus Clostridium helianthi]|uniref:DNA-binding response regulator n=1 Tax=Candidatus Clostridium helianthi TaxID=3381660 RepID=A0ABW8SBY3_9CLOT
MLDKARVKELYLKGYGACQISNILNCKPETVRKCIERNLKDFRNSHLANKIRDKEIDRITKYESKKYMSDATFIKKNRSIYKTTADGDLVVDRNVAPIITYDTPRRFANENSEKEINRKIIRSGYRKDELLY